VWEKKRKIHIGRTITLNSSSSLLMTQKIVLFGETGRSVRVQIDRARCDKRVLPSHTRARRNKEKLFFQTQRSVPMAHSVNKIEKARQQRRANFHQIIIFFHHIVRTSAIFGALICAGSGILHELCALPSGKIVTQFGARVRSTETDGPLTNCDTQKSPQQGRMRRTICKKSH
jgi:hypothetical protein